MPVANYQPEFLALFQEASTRTVRIGPLKEKEAQRFRAKMNRLRVDMRKEQHPMLPLAERVTIQLEEESGQDSFRPRFFVICTPEADRDFVDAIKRAGVALPEPAYTPPAPTAIPMPGEHKNVELEKLLQDFRSEPEET